jgi:hypothetical protein
MYIEPRQRAAPGIPSSGEKKQKYYGNFAYSVAFIPQKALNILLK